MEDSISLEETGETVSHDKAVSWSARRHGRKQKPTCWFLLKKDDVITENNSSPTTCVEITTPRACRTGFRLRIHFCFVLAFFSEVPVGASSGIQEALTHSYNPANIIPTLTMTALGRKLPILRKTSGPVIM